MEDLQFEIQDIRHKLFWNLGGNREGEIFGRGTSGLNSLDTPRSFLLLLLLLISVLPQPKSCVLSLRKMCCVTTQRTFPMSSGTIQRQHTLFSVETYSSTTWFSQLRLAFLMRSEACYFVSEVDFISLFNPVKITGDTLCQEDITPN